MALQIDPEVAAALAVLAPATPAERPPVGDIATRRVTARQMFERAAAFLPAVGGIEVRRYTMRTDDGATIPLTWYRRAGAQRPGSAALYLHGGGMILGLDELGTLYDTAVSHYVAASGVPILVADYRIAPEHPHPAPVNDCYAALLWLADHAAELEVDPARLAVVGDSAGGGLAAAVCLLARDRAGPPIAAQLLFYPMLDDRTTASDPALEQLATWTYDDNRTGWEALFGTRHGEPEVSEYAAPARAADLSRLPPAYVDVGDLDIFRDEVIEYARRLAGAGVPTEMHVHPGCPHAFEWLAPQAKVSQRAISDRVRRLRSV
ncbi:alpha/beta hydrolase [Mycobacterium sp. E2733]|uniref:alpha/beta hydrolase n=1 Tax=Mycobacterium sp. E2733 TaxID=1834138 RepID=UPI0007FC7741|nr:alpha/beta hydrolase [Mycobacterium sp. E2733]OBH93347.1 alpha/beta hydrolase [Mycobacterium sp. E2733]